MAVRNRTRSKWTVQAQARILSSGEAAHGRSGPYMRNRAKTQCTVEVDRLILSVRSKWPVQAHARILSGGETAHGRSGPYRRNRAKTQCTVEVDRQQVCVGRSGNRKHKGVHLRGSGSREPASGGSTLARVLRSVRSHPASKAVPQKASQRRLTAALPPLGSRRGRYQRVTGLARLRPPTWRRCHHQRGSCQACAKWTRT